MAEVNQTVDEQRSEVVIRYDDVVALRDAIKNLAEQSGAKMMEGIIDELKFVANVGDDDEDLGSQADRASKILTTAQEIGKSSAYQQTVKMITRMLDGRPVIVPEDDV